MRQFGHAIARFAAIAAVPEKKKEQGAARRALEIEPTLRPGESLERLYPSNNDCTPAMTAAGRQPASPSPPSGLWAL